MVEVARTEFILGGQRNQPIRLIKAGGDGLFDKDMPPRRKRLFRQRVMKPRGGGDDHRLGRRDHFLGRQGRGAHLPGDLGGPLGRGIMQADQVDGGVGGGLERMEAAKMTDPQNAKAELCGVHIHA